MKKNLYKLLSLILTVCLCATILSGCGSNTANTATSSAAVSTGSAQASASEETAAPAAEALSTSASVLPAQAELQEKIVKVLATDSVRIAYIPVSTANVTNRMIEMAFHDIIGDYQDTVTVDFFDPAFDVQTQITMMNNCVTQQYDCIMLEALDPVALCTPVDEAEAAGIPVITVNLKAETTYSLDLRGPDYTAGWKAAKAIAEARGADSSLNVTIVDFPAYMLSTALQSKGFMDYMEENTNWNLLDQRCIEMLSQDAAYTVVRDMLTKYDNIDVIFNVTDECTAGTIQAVTAAGRNDGNLIVYGNYGLPMTFNDLTSEDGVLYGLNFFDYYNQYCMAMSYALYLAATHSTAVSQGLNETPVIAGSVVPITREDGETYRVLSRWDMALEFQAE